MTNAYIGKKGVELKITSGDKQVASFTIAVKKDFKDKEYNYFSCVLWGKMAEWLSVNQDRISKIGVEGRLETRSYEKDGEKKYVTEIICNHVEVEEWKKEDVPYDETKNESRFGSNDGVTPVDDSDIPF